MTMQVQIQHTDGGDVSLDDCAKFSVPMGEALENSSIANDSYILEVSSPGIGEYLSSDKDFHTFKSFPVEVNCIGEESEKSHEGLLLERSDKHVHLNIKGRIKRIPRESVKSVRLTHPTG